MITGEENITDNIILKLIAKEIEEKHNCKVVEILFVQLISLCVRFKIKFNDDFLYKPFKNLPTPDIICFSDRSATFVRRVDLFDCVKNKIINN